MQDCYNRSHFKIIPKPRRLFWNRLKCDHWSRPKCKSMFMILHSIRMREKKISRKHTHYYREYYLNDNLRCRYPFGYQPLCIYNYYLLRYLGIGDRRIRIIISLYTVNTLCVIIIIPHTWSSVVTGLVRSGLVHASMCGVCKDRRGLGWTAAAVAASSRARSDDSFSRVPPPPPPNNNNNNKIHHYYYTIQSNRSSAPARIYAHTPKTAPTREFHNKPPTPPPTIDTIKYEHNRG